MGLMEADFSCLNWNPKDKLKRNISSEETWAMSKPWVNALLFTNSGTLRSHVCDNIFETLLEESDVTVNSVRDNLGADNEAVIEMVNSPRLQVDFGYLAEQIYTLSSGEQKDEDGNILKVKQS